MEGCKGCCSVVLVVMVVILVLALFGGSALILSIASMFTTCTGPSHTTETVQPAPKARTD
ncbi:MAG: hypothetical protein HUK15_04350, partial [Bacteroidales bacterium]|nr:hypothetical protein [Bacteroidales bacterium]